MSDPCRDAFEAKYGKRASVDLWMGFHAGWNARPMAEVPSEPTIDQYMEAYDDDCTDEAFGELAWSGNDDATSVDHAHAAGFHRGWLTLRELITRCKT